MNVERPLYPFWIDKSKNCFIDSIESAECVHNECANLEKLQNGLFVLATTVRDLESDYIQKNTNGNHIKIGIGNEAIDGITPHNVQLLSNYFHWFANDIVNYVRLAGFSMLKLNGNITDNDVRNNPEKIKQLVNQYALSVEEIKLVKLWRNKVSAHFAITSHQNESSSLLYQSLIQPIGFWFNQRYTTSVIQVQIENETEGLPQWSVSEVFESLAPRYWPDNHEFFHNRFKGFRFPPNQL